MHFILPEMAVVMWMLAAQTCKGVFDCISTYTQLCAFQVRKIKHEALIRNSADLKETLISILLKRGSSLPSFHLNNSEQWWESKGEHFSSLTSSLWTILKGASRNPSRGAPGFSKRLKKWDGKGRLSFELLELIRWGSYYFSLSSSL